MNNEFNSNNESINNQNSAIYDNSNNSLNDNNVSYGNTDNNSIDNVNNLNENLFEGISTNNNLETINSESYNDASDNQNASSQNVNQIINESLSDGFQTDIDVSYFDGSMLELFGYHFLRVFITVFTFTVFKPWADCIFMKYKYSHTIYSGKRLKFDGDPEDLFVQRFKWILLSVITLGIYLFWVPVKKKQWELSNVHFEDEPLVEGNSYFTGSVLDLFGTNLLCLLLIVISFGLLTPLAYCKRVKWVLNNSVICNNFVQFEGSAVKLFLKQLLWGLLTIVTLGIYGFWLEIKTTRWVVNNTYLIKDNG